MIKSNSAFVHRTGQFVPNYLSTLNVKI